MSCLASWQLIITAVIVGLIVLYGTGFIGKSTPLVKKAMPFTLHERCKATGKTTSQYAYEIEKELYKDNKEEAVKKYIEFQKCFPKKEPAIPCKYLRQVNRDAKVCE